MINKLCKKSFIFKDFKTCKNNCAGEREPIGIKVFNNCPQSLKCFELKCCLRFYFNTCKCLCAFAEECICALVEDRTAVFKFILCPFKDADKIVVPDQFAPKTYRFLVRAEANFSRGFLWSFVICSNFVEHSLSSFNFFDIPFNE